MNTDRQNYAEFWDFYVSEHSRPATRILHFAGTLLGILTLIYFVSRGLWYYFPPFFVIGYGFACFGHFVIEKNRHRKLPVSALVPYQ